MVDGSTRYGPTPSTISSWDPTAERHLSATARRFPFVLSVPSARFLRFRYRRLKRSFFILRRCVFRSSVRKSNVFAHLPFASKNESRKCVMLKKSHLIVIYPVAPGFCESNAPKQSEARFYRYLTAGCFLQCVSESRFRRRLKLKRVISKGKNRFSLSNLLKEMEQCLVLCICVFIDLYSF